jgi:hypothetical protein
MLRCLRIEYTYISASTLFVIRDRLLLVLLEGYAAGDTIKRRIEVYCDDCSQLFEITCWGGLPG